MPLQAGTRLGPYEIVSLLGVGGMGEVYCASDTKLGRQVALKVLPDALAMDSERMTRFTREAHVLASLNHPNIAAIYGVEGPAIVMELVEGKDLTVPLPLDEALPIATELLNDEGRAITIRCLAARIFYRKNGQRYGSNKPHDQK